MNRLRHFNCINYAEHGFTLIEVLTALTIAALVVVQLISTMTRSNHTLSALEERTLAHMVAMNKMVEITQADGFPALGKKDSVQPMARRQWQVSVTVNATDNPALRKVEIKVGTQDAAFGSQTRFLVRLQGVKGGFAY